MIKYYFSEAGTLRQLDEPKTGCWVSLINPDEVELMSTAERFGVDIDALRSALDTDERSRIEIDEAYTMVLVDIPTLEDGGDNELYTTIPLSITTTPDAILTVCMEETPVLRPFLTGRIRDFNTAMKSRFILQILYQNASLFLQYLHIIDRNSEIVENKLHKSTQNSELIELLRLEKSLVYFTTALRSNEAVMEKLLRSSSMKKYPEDGDLLEDVIVENKQAIEMANIYSGILSGMMDAFASVISNNLNIVMKLLAIVTIVMSIPTMIFSAYGMNLAAVGMPLSTNPYGFLAIVLGSVVLSLLVALALIKIKMFK